MPEKSESKNCLLCGRFEDFDRQQHEAGDNHRFNYFLKEYNVKKKKNYLNRDGLEITFSLSNNNIDCLTESSRRGGKYIVQTLLEPFLEGSREIRINAKIRNLSRDAYQIVPKILHPFITCSIEGSNYYDLNTNMSCCPIIKFVSENDICGSYKIPLAFTVQPVRNKDKYFTIYRHIEIYIKQCEYELLSLEESPFRESDWKNVQKTVEPLRMPKITCNFPILKTERRIFISGLEHSERHNTYETARIRDITNIITSGLNADNYADFFHNLLWIDEAALLIGLQRYQMADVAINLIRGQTLELHVPGLAEKRPSIVLGDIITMRLHSDNVSYQGVVETISEESVFINHAHQHLLDYLGVYTESKVDVIFTHSRLQYERMHSGIENSIKHLMLSCLFPRQPVVKPNREITLRLSDLFNTSIFYNHEQRSAVESILNRTSHSAPYIIFGPPGTGKTVTIVEAILQLKKRFPDMHILICAPSNAACDMLTNKLTDHDSCTSKDIFRVYSGTRDITAIPQNIIPYSNCDGDVFDKVDAVKLKEYRIVVSTLHLIGKFAGYYSPDILFIDEAAQATEPECDIPIGLMTPNQLIVLAGDPKQLGSVCASVKAMKLGLDKSLMERLMDTNELYQQANTGYDHDYITMLRTNYRSHVDIITIPNELFYNSALISSEHNDVISTTCVSARVLNIKKNKTGNCAVEFCGVSSKERKEGISPSYFNEMEIQMVLKYVKQLLNLSNIHVLESDIGIIAPYIRQVQKIQRRLKEGGHDDIEVGTTESFQGREKRIMIISTVRAQHSLLRYDQKYSLGFVRNSRRFNVALTRAKSKLIVIGNPTCLGTDKNWLTLIEFCEDKNSFFGVKYRARDDAVKQDIRRRISEI